MTYNYVGTLTLDDGTILESPSFTLKEITWHVETNRVSAMVHFIGTFNGGVMYDIARVFEQDLGIVQLIDEQVLTGLVLGFSDAIQNA